MSLLTLFLVVVVLLGAMAPLIGAWQYLLIGVHAVRTHVRATAPYLPRTVVLIPAWNEAAVIGASIDRLLDMDYPADRLRVIVVDDASTDATPDVVLDRAARHPGRVIHVRTSQGGLGKAHALNQGLEGALADDWAETILIADADVQFERGTLRRMTRHLADSNVGAVTAYIKEGTHQPSYLNRFISYEYVTAQAAARRTQNVLGGMACLAGGAQLHARKSLEAIGGRIDTSTFAEDTVATFETQLAGKGAVFDPHAVVWAEEPADLHGLWKQRMRWGRGNLQVTRRYRKVWFRRSHGHGLGGITFGLAWFSVLLQPITMITASLALVALLSLSDAQAWAAFRALWIINAVCYMFTTLSSFMIDPRVARIAWREGLLFPGLISVVIIVATCLPPGVGLGLGVSLQDGITGWFLCLWLAGCMAVAWLALRVERMRGGRVLSRCLLYLAGYGAFLCLVTLSAYIQQLRGSEQRWDKTEKRGSALMAP